MLVTCGSRILSGNAVEVTVAWRDMNGDPDTPLSVRYQVFDSKDGSPVSAVVDVPDVAEDMTFIVPASDLPVGTNKVRQLVIQIEGTFTGDSFTTQLHIDVLKRFNFD